MTTIRVEDCQPVGERFLVVGTVQGSLQVGQRYAAADDPKARWEVLGFKPGAPGGGRWAISLLGPPLGAGALLHSED